jgi:hypothetical protein
VRGVELEKCRLLVPCVRACASFVIVRVCVRAACASSLSECVSASSACVCVRPVNSDLESGVIRGENLLLGCRDEAIPERAL